MAFLVAFGPPLTGPQVAPQFLLSCLQWKFRPQAERAAEAVGEIDQSDQEMEINHLGLGEVLLQSLDIAIGNRLRCARQLLRMVRAA